ncbi:MAG TPA: hypothetical protein VK072_01825 [Candidatus Avamphibacillus sp.]|nr:hypothetical protein [Candidatus Avamphibacillus sp.]
MKKASKIAVQHFIEEGIHDIGIVTTTLNQHLIPRLERVNGYRKAFKSYGLPESEEFIIKTDLKQIKKSVKHLLSFPHPPRGLIAGNDYNLN